MSRILVTGASGFIGRNVLQPLRLTGHEVFAVAREQREGASNEARWLAADLLDPTTHAALMRAARPEVLLHLAWYAVPGKFWSAPENTTWAEASKNLVQAFANTGGRRVVAAGSCAEYDLAAGVCDEENTPLRPATLYGQKKNELRAWLEHFAGERGLGWSWGRVFWLYGPGEHEERLVAHVIRNLLRGEPAKISSGEQRRDFLHVADVASAFAVLAWADAVGCFNISSGEAVAVREIAQRIAQQLGSPNGVRFGEIAAQGPPLVVGVNRRLSGLGWRRQFDLERGLADTIRWFQGAAAHAR